jgi:N6-adenosine-specific RNA methylase IME4
MRAWGFSYKSCVAWRKITINGKVRLGCGYISRSTHENILIASRGKPKIGKPFRSLFDGLAREHSRKPDEFYALAEAFAPGVRRADLFGRESRSGWDVWGAEATKFDEAA